MIALWPFSQWGLDIMGPFSTTIRLLTFIVDGIDYFTRWVEAEALATIMEKKIRSFVWRNIICRYGIPRVLVSDNGKQFDNSAFRDFCLELGIKNHYSSPAHPPGQRIGRGYEPILAQDHHNSAWGGKGHLAGWTFERFVGIPNDSKNTYRGNTILTSVR